MTFRLHHDWHLGVTLQGIKLATCTHCGALRVRNLDDTTRHFIRRRDPDDGRVVHVEPPCVTERPYLPPFAEA